MRLESTGALRCLALGVVVLTTGCNRSPAAPSTPVAGSTPGRTVRSIEVVGPTVVSTGETARSKAFVQYSDGARDDVTGAVQWAPGTPPGGLPQTCLHSLCFTGPPGVALGVRPGETRVFASYQRTISEVPVGVVDPGTFEITGAVTEPGGVPILGALVELTAGPGQGLQARTDTNGRYGIYGVAGPVQVRVSAEGGLPEIARGRAYQVEFNQVGTRLESRISGPTLTVNVPQPRTGTVHGSRVRLQLPGDTTMPGGPRPTSTIV
jgi:hypothetical protein